MSVVTPTKKPKTVGDALLDLRQEMKLTRQCNEAQLNTFSNWQSTMVYELKQQNEQLKSIRHGVNFFVVLAVLFFMFWASGGLWRIMSLAS